MSNTNPRVSKNVNTYNRKSIFSCNVYRTNTQQRSPVRKPAVNKNPEVLYYNDKILKKRVNNNNNKNSNDKTVKECSTQTSKTILMLAQNETTNNETQKNDAVVNNNETNSKLQTNCECQSGAGVSGYQTVETRDEGVAATDLQNQNTNFQAIGNNWYNEMYASQKRMMVENLNSQRTYNVGEANTFNMGEPYQSHHLVYNPPLFYGQNNYDNSMGQPPYYDNPFRNSYNTYMGVVFPEKQKVEAENQNYMCPPAQTQTVCLPCPIEPPNSPNRSPSPVTIEVKIEVVGDKSKDVKNNPNDDDPGQMSPDSLTASPRQEDVNNASLYNCPYSLASHLSDFTLDGSCYEQDCIFNNKTLTEQFLEKNRDRIWEAESNSSITDFKSKSLVDNFFHPNYIQEPEGGTIRNKYGNTRDSWPSLNLPDNSFKERRNKSTAVPSTLMCPTLASSIKSQMADIQNAMNLVPPMRRGRSVSPKSKRLNNMLETSKKIPYIDQSHSDISSVTTLINVSRNPELARLAQVEGDDDDDDSCKFRSNSFSLLTNVGSSNSTIHNDYIVSAVAKLSESDWKVALKGLADVVEICRVMDLPLLYEYMPTINQKLLLLLKSPRSHIVRTACKAAGHLFEYVQDTTRPVFDEIVDTLLHKTADANRFIRQDANLALDSMVTHIPFFNAVRVLCAKGPYHKNPLVRCATARLLVCAVVIAGTDVLFNPNKNEGIRKTVILNMKKLLEDKNLNTRRVAERLYKVLSKDTRFDIYLRKYLEVEQIEKIKRNLLLVPKK